MVAGIYAGSFDPISNGHLDIIKRSLNVCDRLIVGVGINPTKKSLFSDEEKINLIEEAIESIDFLLRTHIEIKLVPGLLIDFAKEQNINMLIRGIRSVSDFEYEINLANIYKAMNPELDTFFLPTNPTMAIISSSAAKEIAKFGGNIDGFVPANVALALRNKFKNKSA